MTHWLSGWRGIAISMIILQFAFNAEAQEAPAPASAGAGPGPAATPAPGAAPVGPAAVPPAEAQTKVQENKVEEAEDKIALARSGKLLRYGVTAGAALTVQTPFASTNGVKVNSAAVSIMPYLGALPAYWTANEERATYCSTTGLFQDGEQARRAATAISRKTAKIELEAMVSWLKTAGFQGITEIDEAQISTALAKFGREAPYDNNDTVYLLMVADSLALPDPAQRELQQQEIASVLAARRWRPELASSCGWYRLGFWVGRPFQYSTDVTIAKDRSSSDVNPVVAFGVMYVPNSYFTVMLGSSYNTVLDTTNAERKLHRAVWTLTLGLGGTLDIASLLAKN